MVGRSPSSPSPALGAAQPGRASWGTPPVPGQAGGVLVVSFNGSPRRPYCLQAGIGARSALGFVWVLELCVCGAGGERQHSLGVTRPFCRVSGCPLVRRAVRPQVPRRQLPGLGGSLPGPGPGPSSSPTGARRSQPRAHTPDGRTGVGDAGDGAASAAPASPQTRSVLRCLRLRTR